MSCDLNANSAAFLLGQELHLGSESTKQKPPHIIRQIVPVLNGWLLVITFKANLNVTVEVNISGTPRFIGPTGTEVV